MPRNRITIGGVLHMAAAVELAEIWRGDVLESVHSGHAVICDDTGEIIEAWGDPTTEIYPRSSCKMIQALPLIESGAAKASGLTAEHLALACASHNGAHIHTDRVQEWLSALGLGDADLRCGPQLPNDMPARNEIIKTDDSPCQYHNNCSGKHTGFLTLNKHLGGGPDYDLIDSPVQVAVRGAFEETTGETSQHWERDGCSAPNFTTSVHGLARAMAGFAAADGQSGARAEAMVTLTQAMMTHPDLVAGETRACTHLMRACKGRAALKTGAEGVFAAILPGKRIGIALKIADGTTRAAECAITALLVKLGVLDARHPEAIRFGTPPIKNRRDIVTGQMRPSAALS